MTQFIVAGAGLGGSLMAALLGRAGHRVLVLERRADPRTGVVEAGRSINLAISERVLAWIDRPREPGEDGELRAYDLATGQVLPARRGPTGRPVVAQPASGVRVPNPIMLISQSTPGTAFSRNGGTEYRTERAKHRP